MNIGAAQSQSLLAATRTVSATATQVTAARILSRDPEGPNEAVVLSVNRRIDYEYGQRVLTDSVENRLNKALEKAGVDTKNAEPLVDKALDVTPEATAKRITEFATSYFGAYQRNHPDVEAEKQLDEFTALVKDAVQAGFADARETLSGIGTIPEKVDGDIDKTLELAMQGIDKFAGDQLKVLSPPNPEDVPQNLLAL